MQSGKYTGVNCHGKEKVKRFYEAFPNGKIDSFYSDSYSDSPLAEIADKAFMVDGDKIESWILIKWLYGADFCSVFLLSNLISGKQKEQRF